MSRTGASGRGTRLPGHGLVSEGIPQFVAEDCNDPACRFERDDSDLPSEELRVHDRFAGGHGRCSCGAESEHLPSQGVRRRWHTAHKEQVRQAQASEAETPLTASQVRTDARRGRIQ